MLTGEMQVQVAAEKILTSGPEALIIKRGEHGAWLFTRNSSFFATAFPLKEVIDPTGAGDSFAGGLMGYLAGVGSTDESHIRKGMVYGTAIASATCEGFGVERTREVERADVDIRYEQLLKMVSVETES